ncbi:MAG: hypothetical protein LBB54_05190, partial [Cellulomonadaceae bacterium]|nr:hypothetical protein [Cellulomonadaceae bacterium]
GEPDLLETDYRWEPEGKGADEGLDIPLLETGTTDVSWPIVNLILALLGLIAVALVTAAEINRRRRENDDNSDDNDVEVAVDDAAEAPADGDNEKTNHAARNRGLAVCALLAVGGIVFFFLTETIAGRVALVDHWTWVHVLLAAGLAALLVPFIKHPVTEKADDADAEDTNDNAAELESEALIQG